MKLLHSGAIYATANIASAALPFLLLPLLTRVLGPAEYASVVAFMLLVTLCQTTAGLSANAALGMTFFKRSPQELPAYIGSALAMAVASTLLTAAAVALVLWAAPALGGGISPAWGALAALTAGANIVLQCRLVLWQSQHQALASAALQFTTSAVNVGLSLLAVLTFSWGAEGRNAGICASTVLAGLLAAGLLLRSGELRWAPTREHWRSLARYGLPLVGHALAGVLLATADRWAVSLQLDARALGVYGAGAQLGMVMAMLSDAFVKAYTPWLYGLLRSAEARDRQLAVGAVYATLPAFVLVGCAVGIVLCSFGATLLGPKYSAAVQVVPWFMLGGAAGGLYMCTAALLFYAGRTTHLATISLLSALCGACATWWLVGSFGLQGAAAGYALTQALLATLTTAVVVRTVALPWNRPLAALSALGDSFAALRPRAQALDGHKPTL